MQKTPSQATGHTLSVLNCAFSLVTLFVFAITCFGQSTMPPIKNVFVIVEGGSAWSEITAVNAPYIRSNLLSKGAHAEQYYNPPGVHPSLPNYLWMEAGSNLGVTTDDPPTVNHQSTTDHLSSYLDKAGISWRAYAEDISGEDCPLVNTGDYAYRHNPFIYFDDVTGGNNATSSTCISHIRPYSELPGDLLANRVASYNFIIPNSCDDMRDCSVTQGDTWLSYEVPRIMASPAYQNGGVLFIVWEQSDSGDGPIGMIALSPYAKVNYSNNVHYTHSSLLKTLEEVLNVGPLLRDAANATDLSDLFTNTPVGPITQSSPIVNAASYGLSSTGGGIIETKTVAIAPGSIAAIFGTGLTDGSSCLPPTCYPAFDSTGKLNQTLNGTQVTLNGAPAPLFYVSPKQLAIQIPSELSGSTATAQVTVGGQVVMTQNVTLTPYAPGIFSASQDGKGVGVITHLDGSLVSPDNPANPNEMVTLYATGLGPLTPNLATGMVPSATTKATAAVTIYVDGTIVKPDFAGVAGCCVGLNQINFQLPSNTRTGNDIPVYVVAGGVNSNIVNVSATPVGNVLSTGPFLHWHPWLTIFLYGTRYTIDANTGIIGDYWAPIHTHDTTGKLHEEMFGTVTKEDTKLYNFFNTWGKVFNKNCIFTYCNGPNGQVHFSVNGLPNSKFEQYELRDLDDVVISYPDLQLD